MTAAFGTTAFADSEAVVPAEKSIPDCDRIWFYNMSGGEFAADMILVESNGRYGLIDTGNRYENTIEDADGTVYSVPSEKKLSCQTEGRNGRDAVRYMAEALGVDHLDFIIATHAHSDHIGGIPEIAGLDIMGRDGETRSLIDDTTVYFYKTYQHINNTQDDMDKLQPLSSGSWHNQAFVFQAMKAVMEKGVVPVDLSFASFGQTEGTESLINAALKELCADTEVKKLSFALRESDDQLDDRVSFCWENMIFDLYNLYPISTAVDENVNSIVTVVTVDGHKVYLGGDVDVQGQTEQKIAEVIERDHGKMDLMKASHHGFNYSNSKTAIDLLMPDAMVSTSKRTGADEPSQSMSYRTMKYYADRYYGTIFYVVGAAERMLSADFERGVLRMQELKGAGPEARLTSADGCLDTTVNPDGWAGWFQEYNSSENAVWYYFINGEPLTGWQRIEGDWYCFDDEGIMLYSTWTEDSYGKSWFTNNGKLAVSRWVLIDGEWYYFKDNGYMAHDEWVSDSGGRYWMDSEGRITRSAWLKDGNDTYLLGEDGHPVTEAWKKDEIGWMWLGADGRLVKEAWILSRGEWYYISADGYMVHDDWTRDSHGEMFMDSSGRITRSKWIKSDGEWYYFKANGYMARKEWTKDSKGWMYMDENGRITKDKWIRSGSEWYYLKASGYMAAKEWTKDSKGWMYMDKDGKITRAKWLKYCGAWYYLKADGYMATGTMTIDGKKYTFGKDGKWIEQ